MQMSIVSDKRIAATSCLSVWMPVCACLFVRQLQLSDGEDYSGEFCYIGLGFSFGLVISLTNHWQFEETWNLQILSSQHFDANPEINFSLSSVEVCWRAFLANFSTFRNLHFRDASSQRHKCMCVVISVAELISRSLNECHVNYKITTNINLKLNFEI